MKKNQNKLTKANDHVGGFDHSHAHAVKSQEVKFKYKKFFSGEQLGRQNGLLVKGNNLEKMYGL